MTGSRRVTGVRDRAARPSSAGPRIDVTVRISGFFRDAFPHVISLIDDAIAAVAELDEPPESNYVRAHARPTARGTVTAAGPRPGSSARSPARTAPACCR